MAFGVLFMSPDTFWNMTYAEFCLALKGYNMSREHDMSNSWWTAQLTATGYHNPKKFPKLASLLGSSKELSDEERSSARAMLSNIPKTRKLKGN